jgi:transposase
LVRRQAPNRKGAERHDSHGNQQHDFAADAIAEVAENRPTDRARDETRNLVERFFNKIKYYRAIATRFDKLANTFLAGVLLVCVVLWLN